MLETIYDTNAPFLHLRSLCITQNTACTQLRHRWIAREHFFIISTYTLYKMIRRATCWEDLQLFVRVQIFGVMCRCAVYMVTGSVSNSNGVRCLCIYVAISMKLVISWNSYLCELWIITHIASVSRRRHFIISQITSKKQSETHRWLFTHIIIIIISQWLCN